MPTLRICFQNVLQVLLSMVEWLLWFVSYIYKPEYALRAERPVPVEHEEDREDTIPVPCTEPNNLVYINALLTDLRFPVQCTQGTDLSEDELY